MLRCIDLYRSMRSRPLISYCVHRNNTSTVVAGVIACGKEWIVNLSRSRSTRESHLDHYKDYRDEGSLDQASDERTGSAAMKSADSVTDAPHVHSRNVTYHNQV